MAHSDDTRRKLRAAYVIDQLSLEVAALKCAVPVPTARRWKSEAKAAGDNWDRAQSAHLIAGGGMEDVLRQTLAIMVQQVQATIEDIQQNPEIPALDKVKAMASLADSHTKIASVQKRMMPETDKLGVAMDVIRRELEFARARYPQHVAAIAEILEPFGEELAKAYG